MSRLQAIHDEAVKRQNDSDAGEGIHGGGNSREGSPTPTNPPILPGFQFSVQLN